jgi:hypothetical protein
MSICKCKYFALLFFGAEFENPSTIRLFFIFSVLKMLSVRLAETNYPSPGTLADAARTRAIRTASDGKTARNENKYDKS